MPEVRTKSQPVPRGITASSTSRPAIPLTTSLTVPSPPTATSSEALAAASRASSVRWPGRSDISASPCNPSAAAWCASSGQRLPAAPASAAGLTRKVTALMAAGHGRECDTRHAVDRGAQLVVRDARELLADHDVAHRQQAAGLDPAQCADREQHRRFHLDAEHAAGRPALVPLGIRVVKGVAGGDRADAQRLLELP